MQGIDVLPHEQFVVIIMETIDKLPEQKAVIGTKEVVNAAKAGKVKMVVVAKNCPQFLADRIMGADLAGKVQVRQFSGDQSDLGTRLGKPFPVAMVGY